VSDVLSFTDSEQVIVQTARRMEPGKLHFIAIGGPPLIAALLARRLYQPDIAYLVEDGTVDPQVELPAPSFMVGFSAAARRAVAWTDMNTVDFYSALGYVDYGVLAAVQVDQYGNFNSSMLGEDYSRPVRRFGGPGGANEIASLSWRTILMTRLQPRKFVRKVDFSSSPGFLDGTPGARERAGLPPGTGPYRVITEDAIFGFDPETRRMALLERAPWTSVDSIMSRMEFEPLVDTEPKVFEPPTVDELAVLRAEVDPTGRTIAGEWIVYDLESRTVQRARSNE